MSDPTNTAIKKSGWKKYLVIGATGLVLLVAVAYGVLTSGWFLKSVVLPKVSQAMNATVTVQDASISPLSQVRLTGLQVKTTGAEPLLAVREFSVRYPSLMNLISGTIALDEISIAGLEVNVVQNPDGTSNLDPLLKAQTSAPATATQPASGAPPQVQIKKVALTDARLRYTRNGAQESMTADISQLNVTLENIANGQTLKCAIQNSLAYAQKSGRTESALQAGLKGAFEVPLDAKLAPVSARGSMDLTIPKASGAFADVAAMAANLQCDWSPSEIKALALKLSQNNQVLASASLSGPFDAAKQEGKLKFDLSGIDRKVLNIAGAAAGLDFNQTMLSANGELEVANGAQNLTARGAVKAARLSVTMDKQQTPPMDVEVNYSVAVKQGEKLALIDKLSLAATQSGRPVITGSLSKPMPINWGAAAEAVSESSFLLAIQDLDLREWRAFAKDLDPSGRLKLNLNLVSHKAGRQLMFDLTGGLGDFSVAVSSNQVVRGDLTVGLKGGVENFSQLDLASASLLFRQGQESVLLVNGSGRLNATNQDAGLRLNVMASLPRLVTLAGLTNAQFSDGRFAFNGTVQQKNLNPAQTKTPAFSRSLAGRVELNDLTGKYDVYGFDRFNAAADCDLQLTNDLALIRKLAVTFMQSGKPAGAVEVSGQHNLAQTNGQLSLKLTDVNENLLRTAAALLGSNKLERVQLNASLAARYDARGETAAQGQVRVTDLLITDPAGQFPKTPMTAEANLDLGMKGQIAEIRALNGSVKQGEASGGSFDLTGRFDLARTNGQFNAKVVDLNQNALRPFLGAALGDVTLQTVSINLAAAGKLDPAGESSVTGSVQVLNLLLHDAKGQMPKEPQSVAAHLDGSLQKNVLNLRDASLQLTPTARASNWVSLSGKLNLANPSAVSGSLALKVDALDATYYYRLYASRPAAPPPPATTSSSSVPAANVEPDPVILPLTNFNFTADIRSFYLEEIAVSNIAAQLKVDGGKVELPKLQAVINGAPLAGKLAANLGVPGYVYDLDFNLQRLPLQPVVASFMPQAKDGVRGDMTLALAVKGAGTTGRNLKQTLSGGMVMDVTNAAVVVKSLIQPKRTGNVSPGNQFLIVLTGVLDPVLNSVGQAVGIPNLTSEPFNTSRMEMKFGAGNLTLADFTLANRKIFVGSQGRIPIADDLMQSPLDLPVQIALSRELAQRFNIANAPTNATHVKLPDFVLVKGTLEKPETKLNTKALTGTALQQIGKQVGGDAGGVLQGLGNLLGGGTKAITNAPPSQANSPATSSTTNKPPTNAPVNNLINDLFKPKPRQ